MCVQASQCMCRHLNVCAGHLNVCVGISMYVQASQCVCMHLNVCVDISMCVCMCTGNRVPF